MNMATSDQKPLDNVRVFSRREELSCPRHQNSRIIEAELYYGGFHNYRGIVCYNCAEERFSEGIGMCIDSQAESRKVPDNSQGFLEYALGELRALEDPDTVSVADLMPITTTILRGSSGGKLKLLREGKPILDPLDSEVLLLGYICPSCDGILKGRPISSERSDSKEAMLAFEEKKRSVKHYGHLLGTANIIAFDDHPQEHFKSGGIYTCKHGHWIGKSTGDVLYW